MLQEAPKVSIYKMRLKTTLLELQPFLSLGHNELTMKNTTDPSMIG